MFAFQKSEHKRENEFRGTNRTEPGRALFQIAFLHINSWFIVILNPNTLIINLIEYSNNRYFYLRSWQNFQKPFIQKAVYLAILQIVRHVIKSTIQKFPIQF